MKNLLFALFLFPIILFAQPDKIMERINAQKAVKESVQPDSTVFKYLISEYSKMNNVVIQKQQNLLKNYYYIPVVADLKSSMDALQKVIEMIQAEEIKLNKLKAAK